MPQVLQREIRDASFGETDSALLLPETGARLFINQLFGPDSGGARRSLRTLLKYYRHDFYRYESCRWRRLDDLQLHAEVVRFLQDGQFGIEITESFVRSTITNLHGLAYVECWDREMPLWIETEKPLTLGSWKLMSMRNGILCLDDFIRANGSLQLHPHTPQWFSTVLLPFDFQADMACPLWIETLNQILSPSQLYDQRIALLQEFIGLTLLPLETRYEKFLVLIGKGGNGKSTVLRIWCDLLGTENVSHLSLEDIAGEFRLCDMVGKLANIAYDMRRMDRLEEGKLKQIVSGEPIQINRKNKPLITSSLTARLIFATNDLPQISDRTDGVWRRMITMPFTVRVDQAGVDRQRHDRLRAELPGVMNWALLGLRRLLTNGQFTTCPVCEQYAHDHRMHSDPIAQFVDEYVELVADRAVLCEVAYDAYAKFCFGNGRRPCGSTEFGRHLMALAGVQKVRQGGGRRQYEYKGIELTEEPASGTAPPSP